MLLLELASNPASFDEIEGVVTGKFHIEMEIDSNTMDFRINQTNEQAKVIFSEGEFSAKILE